MEEGLQQRRAQLESNGELLQRKSGEKLQLKSGERLQLVLKVLNFRERLRRENLEKGCNWLAERSCLLLDCNFRERFGERERLAATSTSDKKAATGLQNCNFGERFAVRDNFDFPATGQRSSPQPLNTLQLPAKRQLACLGTISCTGINTVCSRAKRREGLIMQTASKHHNLISLLV